MLLDDLPKIISWDSYNDSRKNAVAYADKVIFLCKKEKSEKPITDTNAIFLEEAVALAFLIKENVPASNAHFIKAEKLWNQEDEKPESALINITRQKGKEASEGMQIYLPFALFKEYPQQGKWYWPVNKQSEAVKEFLLNCLSGFYME